MTAHYAAATVEVEKPETTKKPARRNPKPLPPHAVVVENDDVHSFDYVVEVFQKVFGYSKHKAFALTLQVHEQGRAIVWSGTKELAEL
ncbi:MAG TPA: ATP-dependent Clp protease adaptor ClpS, partial [Pirellulales bacterium]|nr:ATP-dependent Clp protease adaptor ClpS [Pirellulales bacterium]